MGTTAFDRAFGRPRGLHDLSGSPTRLPATASTGSAKSADGSAAGCATASAASVPGAGHRSERQPPADRARPAADDARNAAPAALAGTAAGALAPSRGGDPARPLTRTRAGL